MKSFRILFTALLWILGVTALANITTTTNRVGPLTCTSLPAALSVTFPFQASSDLLVLDLGQSGTGNDPAVVLTLNSDYTVSGGGYNSTTNMQAGTVTVVSTGAHAVQTNDQIVILRNVPVNQTSSLTSGVLTAASIEKALDKQATLSQQLTEKSNRSLRFEQGETLDGTLIRSARAGKVLGFDADGNIAYSNGGGGGGGGTTYTAGTGLVLASNQFSVNPAQSLTSLTVTNPVVGGVTGNAATATALQTARTINGTSFDGTANVTVTAAAGTLTGTTLAANVTASSLASGAVGTFGSMAIQNANSVNVTGGLLNGASVTGLPSPSASSDAATKAYVDSIGAGITPRTAVVAATTANITLSGPQTIDGQAIIAGNRVLVKNQTAPAENGIYDCAAGAWTRSSDSNTAGQLRFGYYYFVSSGTANGSTSWFIQTAPTVLGTDPVSFAQFSASATYTAGTGLLLTGSRFSANPAFLLFKSNNLSDLSSASTARTNLGLGTIATQAANSVAITGGTINATPIGQTTQAAGGFTALTSSSSFSATAATSINNSFKGSLNAIRLHSEVPGYYIDAVDPTLTGSYQPLALSGTTITLVSSTTPIGVISSTGLAVTGALSATGQITGGRGIVSTDTNPYIVGNSATVGRVYYGSIGAASPVATLVNNILITNVSLTGLAVNGTISATGGWSGDLTLGGTSPYLTLNRGGPAETDGIKFRSAGATTGGWDFYGTAGSSQTLTFYSYSAGSNIFELDATGAQLTGALSINSNANKVTTKGNLHIAVNVKDYGATGDGSTNDSAAIAAAVSALPSSRAYLYFPAGTYITSGFTISGKTGLTVVGDGYGVSIIKGLTGNQLLVINTSSNVTVRGLGFNGNCSARTAGKQAVIIDANGVLFTENKIENSGEYAVMFGGNAETTDVVATNNYIGYNFADGINFQYVTGGVIANNVIDGVDDDCIAVGWNAHGNASNIVVSGNFCRARTDLGTSTGRGIYLGNSSNVLVANNRIDTIKQYGIVVIQESGGARPTRIDLKNNHLYNVATVSGHGIGLYGTTMTTLEGNDVYNQGSGNSIDIANWLYLTIRGGVLTQANNVFARGIHADESSGWGSTTWIDLKIIGVSINMLGAATNSCIYLSPNAANTMQSVMISGCTGVQVAAGDYITLNTSRTSTIGKVVNNTDMTGSRTVSPSSSTGIFTVSNNN